MMNQHLNKTYIFLPKSHPMDLQISVILNIIICHDNILFPQSGDA